MKATVKHSELNGTIAAIPSKSYLHRILIAAALSQEETYISGYIDSQDVAATIECLKRLGAEINIEEGVIAVSPVWKTLNRQPEIDCGESGSTVRFLIPVLSALGVNASVDGKEGLRRRPVTKLLDTLRQNGAAFSGDSLPLTVAGKLHCGRYRIDGTISSQYVTGLLFALPLLGGDSKIILKGQCVSAGYIDITLEVLGKFGIKIEKTKRGFFIRGNQKYTSPRTITAEGDWSNAAFFLAAGAINGNVTVTGLNLNSVQGDREIVNILSKMGADIVLKDDKVTVKKKQLKDVEIDAKDIPDLVPILSILCANAAGASQIRHLERLKIKESDRLEATLKMLQGFGVQAFVESGTLCIIGGKSAGNEFDGFNDHRMIMSEAIGGILAEGETVILNSGAVAKSYPDFFGDVLKLGGNVHVTDV